MWKWERMPYNASIFVSSCMLPRTDTREVLTGLLPANDSSSSNTCNFDSVPPCGVVCNLTLEWLMPEFRCVRGICNNYSRLVKYCFWNVLCRESSHMCFSQIFLSNFQKLFILRSQNPFEKDWNIWHISYWNCISFYIVPTKLELTLLRPLSLDRTSPVVL